MFLGQFRLPLRKFRGQAIYHTLSDIHCLDLGSKGPVPSRICWALTTGPEPALPALRQVIINT
jgi:hypothetical protein